MLEEWMMMSLAVTEDAFGSGMRIADSGGADLDRGRDVEAVSGLQLARFEGGGDG